MASAPKHQQPSSSSKPPKQSSIYDPQIPNPNSTMSNQEDQILSRATHLTRPELLRRRSRHLKSLSKCYRDHYWALMEDLKSQFREYYWKYGVSPFKGDQGRDNKKGTKLGFDGDIGDNVDNGNAGSNVEGCGENGTGNNANNNNNNDGNNRCSFLGCKFKAMALTSFCHLHILSDHKQQLYKPCTYVIKSAQAGPITCGKPILRSTMPSLCNVHYQKAQKHLTRALKLNGYTVSSSSKSAPKFHVIVAELVRQIQAKRRAALKDDKLKGTVKEETPS